MGHQAALFADLESVSIFITTDASLHGVEKSPSQTLLRPFSGNI